MSTISPSEERRSRLVSILRSSDSPVTGADLSAQLGVSRQVIVNDVAIVRATGEQILGSPRGYVLTDGDERPIATIACRHERVGFRRELEILVDRGISVVDVVVEHPLYGEVAANLLVQARSDIDRYIEALDREDAQPLSALTGGVHLHHVRVPNLDALEAARREFAAEGILLADD